nr:hypothetical protein [Bacteroidota bacterium]
MKKLSVTLTVLLFAILLDAQAPQAFKYQAVVRDAAGEVLQNQNVDIRISFHDATAGGTIVYQETFSKITNQFGLVNLEIGSGTPTIGTFTGIDWSNNAKFLEFEFDSEGGSNYISMGTSQLLSVPYALYSENTANTDDADANPTNELQSVSKAGNTVTLSDGGGSFVDETVDADADPTNELNTSVSLDGTNLKVTDAGGTITTGLGSLIDDADANPANELQTVTKAGNTVTLSDGGGSFVDETTDADADPANE